MPSYFSKNAPIREISFEIPAIARQCSSSMGDPLELLCRAEDDDELTQRLYEDTTFGLEDPFRSKR